MLNRLAVSLSLALMGAFAVTGPAFAARGPDAAEVATWTGAAVGCLMAFLLLVYSVKWYFGIDSHAPGPEPEADAHGGHH